MKVLFLTQILPYPLNAGPKVKTWHVLKYLVCQGYEVTLVSFTRPEEEPYLDTIRANGIQVIPVPIRRSRIQDGWYWLRSFIKNTPFLIERDAKPQMYQMVTHLLATGNFDVIHADQVTMTHFALQTKANPLGYSPARIFDAHNATWQVIDRMRKNVVFPLRPLVALEARRMKKYEAQVILAFNVTLAVTDVDRALLWQAVEANGAADPSIQARIKIIPIAVDTKSIQPVQRASGSNHLITLGTLHYPPNADGIRWFLNEIFPLIRTKNRAASLSIIGKNPPQDFLLAAQQNPSAVEITGYVEDLTPYMQRAAVMVIPVRAGGGMRVRILEAFARGIPVVTTTVGLEGIQAVPGRDVLVADTPQAFADAVLRLLQDTEMQQRLAVNGRILVEERYDWKVVLTEITKIYQSFSNGSQGEK